MDTGSTTSLITFLTAKQHNIPMHKLDVPVSAMGLGGEEVFKYSCSFDILIKNTFIKISPFCFQFNMLELNKIDILLGRDLIGIKFGLNIPLDDEPPHLYLKEEQAALRLRHPTAIPFADLDPGINQN